jgi:hypothetical protein
MMLDEVAAAHSARVRDYLKEQIEAAGGWVSFEHRVWVTTAGALKN